VSEWDDPAFLGVDDVVVLHAEQVELFGGASGIRDLGLLESAIAQPQNQYLYSEDTNLFDCAASYAYHISKNHPFREGNKRAGLAAALVFLKVNGVEPFFPNLDLLYERMMSMVNDTISKEAFAHELRRAATRP
jgi:death-on-curing protein